MRPRNFSARVPLIFCVVILSVVSIDFTGRAVATQTRPSRLLRFDP